MNIIIFLLMINSVSTIYIYIYMDIESLCVDPFTCKAEHAHIVS